MFIIEVTKDSKYYDKFLNLVEEAEASPDKLNNNYKTISKTLANLLSFCNFLVHSVFMMGVMISFKWC